MFINPLEDTSMDPRSWTTRPDETFAEAVARTTRTMARFRPTTEEDLDRLAAGETPRQIWPGDYPRLEARS